MRAIFAVRQGGPEVLELQQVPEPAPAGGQMLIRVRSAGVNFADALSTRGQYAAALAPPFLPGLEVAGIAAERPVMAILASGGYAETAVADSRLVFAADGIDLPAAGGYLLVTLTAYYGLAEAVRLRPGESVLMTAGTGGLGSTVIQMARALGASRITAVACTEEKRRWALKYGPDQAIGYEDDFPRTEWFSRRFFQEVPRGGPASARGLSSSRAARSAGAASATRAWQAASRQSRHRSPATSAQCRPRGCRGARLR